MNTINKPDPASDLHKTDQHSEKVYEAEAIQTESTHSGSHTDNSVSLKSTPSSKSVSTTEPELTALTEDVPDKAVASVSEVPSNDSNSTITTVVEVHKSAETESHSSNVNNTESQSDSTQSATDHPSVSIESNVSVIAKTVEMCINISKHTIKRKAETADVQLKSAKIPISSKQTENSEKIERMWDLPPHPMQNNVVTLLKMKLSILSQYALICLKQYLKFRLILKANYPLVTLNNYSLN